MSRYDKYEPISGGFRAPLAVALTATSGPSGVTDLFRVLVVALDTNGRVIKATTALGAVGIVIAHGPKAIGDIIDVMTDGEVVELDGADIQGATTPTAGTMYYADFTASRLVANAAPTVGTNYFRVGQTVGITRLVVRCRPYQGGA